MTRPIVAAVHGFIATIVILAGVPLALVNLAGSPRSLIGTSPTQLSAALTWLVWLYCAVLVLRAIWRGATGAVPSGSGSLFARQLSAVSFAAAVVFGATAPAGADLRVHHHHVSVGTPQPAHSAVVVQSTRQHLVAPGDSLWSIATREYGTGTQWGRLASANLGRVMSDGRRFTDPSLIYAGWMLIVPVRETTTHASTPPAPQRPRVSTSSPESIRTSPASSQPAAHVSADVSDNAVVFVLGPLGLALLGAGVHRRRRRRLAADAPKDRHASSDAVAVSRVAVEHGDPMLSGRLDLALDVLFPTLVGTSPEGIYFARVTNEGITVMGATPPPASVTLVATCDGGWTMALPLIASAAPRDRRLPSLATIPLAADGEGTWVALCEPGSVLELSGNRANDIEAVARLLSEATALTAGPPVADMAVAGGDPSVVSAIVFSSSPVPTPGVVTITKATEGRRGIAHADDLGLTLHTGARVRVFEEVGRIVVGARNALGLDEAAEETPARAAKSDEYTAMPMIRLLARRARIDGLATSLDPARARRAIEVAAYLACHCPESISIDRLRTRVLGTKDSDASAKTVANLVSILRRSLGQGATGLALLPPASAAGHRISAEVALDVSVLSTAISSAAGTSDPESALGHYETGFALIESAPLDDELSGYDWFSAEGHRQHLANAVTAAVERAVDLALELNRPERAAFCLARARLLNPYSERLCRAEMTIASALGEPAEVSRVYDAHCAHLVALDDEATPSEVTTAHRDALLVQMRAHVAT